FAVLYRTHSQSRLLEETLRRAAIPYQVIGATSFYERKEIKDLIAYLRLVVNPYDEQALQRVINVPNRGIGESSWDKVRAWATEQGVSMWEGLCRARTFMQGSTVQAISEFVELIRAAQALNARADAHTVALHLAESSGLLALFGIEGDAEKEARY